MAPKQGVSSAEVVADTGRTPTDDQGTSVGSQTQGCEGFKGSTAPRVR
jgi:ribosomal protein S11